MKRLFFLIILSISFVTYSFAQEICNNGFDDDGDGFIDCFDKECVENALCLGGYIGNDAKCQVTPGQFPQFTMTKDWESANEVVNHLNRVSIGDIDGDGIPEVVSINIATNNIFILNGVGGTTKKSINVNYSLEREPVIGKIDPASSCAMIFTYGSKGGKWRIYAYDCNLNLVWSTPAGSEMPDNPYFLSLADFDGDGKVEIYYKDEIVDANTGIRLVKSQYFKYMAAPVAVDMVGDKKLELVAGCVMFDVNLGTRTLDGGTLTILAQDNSYRVRQETSSATSIADYNLDGFPDVLATGSEDKSGTDLTKNTNQNTTIFFWDVHNNVTKKYIDAFNTPVTVFDCANGSPIAASSGAFYANGWRNGAGRINIADTDGDGKMNAVYVSGKYLYILDENLNQVKRIVVNEETSGYTGCTMFDFNGDGKSEIVYRDEKYVYILYGDGTISNQQKCISRTNREYPIVADVDADGSTEICVTCAFDDNLSDTDFCNQGSVGNQRYSVVRAFKSASDPWVPARRLWNQHAYFNVNVNDDLSIPKQQQKHWIVFSSGSCTQGANYPLNKFLNQSPFLNSDGCPQYAAPDISYIDGSLQINNPTCPDKDFTVSMKIENKGDLAVSSDMPVTFYKGDPRLAGAVKLNTVTVKLTNFMPNDVFNVTNATVKGDGTFFTLFIVLNDAGTSIPSPITLPNTNIIECNYDNFIQADVQPKPVAISALLVKDNIKCGGSTVDNGAVRAFIPMSGGAENTADYNFYWSIGATPKAKPADFTGATYTGLANGVYTVYAVHKTANCNSDTTQATVGLVTKNVDIVISLANPYDNCKVPNGKLKAVVNLGEPAANYDFVWYEGNGLFGTQVGVGDVVGGLGHVTYTVLATDKTTGCSGVETFTILDQTVKPVITTTQKDIICNGAANSGSASASIAGVTTGFTFKWSKGNAVKPTPDFTGATYSSLIAASYTVLASNNTTQCDSDPVTITISRVTNPIVTASAVDPMTSCDAAQPNGSAKANVGNVTKGYFFEWHQGTNILSPIVSTASSPTGFFGNTTYTVVVKDSVTGCSAKKQVTIGSNIQTPSLNLVAVGDVTSCTSPNGSITVKPSIDNPSDYVFTWYNGASVKAISDYPSITGNVLSPVGVGTYTVKAIHQTKHCMTAPISAKVNDATPVVSIVLADSVTKLPSDCTSPDGIMKVYVSAAGNTLGFDIQWYFGRAPFSAGAIQTDHNVTNSKAQGLATGVYTVIATNLDNGCIAISEFNLPFAHAQKLDLVSQIDDDCISLTKGQVTVNLTKTDLPGFDESSYDIFVYNGTNDDPGGPFIEVIHGVLGVTNYTTAAAPAGLAPGDYTIVAVSNNSALPCRSIPVPAKIIKNTIAPVIVPTQIDPNTNCGGVPGTGDIKLNVDAGGNPNDYSFKWYEGSDTASPILGTATSGITSGTNGEEAQKLPAGFYTAEVVNILATSTGCASTATFQVFDNTNVILAVVTTTKRVDCVTQDGTAQVAVSENGVAQPSGNYTFAWTPDPLNHSDFIPGLAGGIYVVTATNTTTNCKTDASFTIVDSTMYSIGVTLASFVNPTKCGSSGPTTGALNVVGTPSGPLYSYQWYKGSSAAPGNKLVPEVNPTLSTALITPPDTVFTIEVTNTVTHCPVTDTYTLVVENIPITLTASAAPLTSCRVPDGSTFAAVTSGPSFNYFYNWSFGNNVKAVADSIQPEMGFLHSKNYTVIAIDKNYPNCKSAPLTVTVDSIQVFPVVSAIANAPMAACDVSKADGIASASVGGDIVSYTFDWYVGPITGTPFYTGNQASNLNANIYAVIATNSVSGCMDTTTVAVLNTPKTIPPPVVTVISDVTTCDLNNPNGSLTVVPANGNPSEYEFTWTKDDDSSFGPKSDQIVADLASGPYTVKEKEIASGCISSAPGVIQIKQTPPLFDLTVINASCNVFVEGGGSSGQPDGSVALFLTNDVGIQSIVWVEEVHNTVVGTGPIVTNIDRGFYDVTVTTDLACTATKRVHVNTDIHPFNGISRNGDGKNENFWINCIDNFPGNLVKIYNRAGTLVYEASNYNNSDVIFDGRSNRGVSPMGTNLPDGTYFYIIDKHDGSKQVAGYLEIVN